MDEKCLTCDCSIDITKEGYYAIDEDITICCDCWPKHFDKAVNNPALMEMINKVKYQGGVK